MFERGPDHTFVERSAIRKVTWRIVPFLTVCYFFAILDRSNVGLASLQMNSEIGLSKAAFGFGGSMYFVEYFLFEVPSNVILKKVGARVWLARIMITWGLIAAGMAFVRGPTHYAVMRFVRGAAEAGFFPGVIFYMMFWIPGARMIAWFMVAIPVSGFLGSQFSAWLLSLDGVLGYRGWRWLFVAEGLPIVLLGIACLFILTDRPEQACWLTHEQKAWLGTRLQSEREAARPVGVAVGRKRLLLGVGVGMLDGSRRRQRTRGLAGAANQGARFRRRADGFAEFYTLWRGVHSHDRLGT